MAAKDPSESREDDDPFVDWPLDDEEPVPEPEPGDFAPLEPDEDC